MCRIRHQRNTRITRRYNLLPAQSPAASLLSELELETSREGIEVGIRHFITFRIEA